MSTTNLIVRVIKHKAMHALLDISTGKLIAVYINKKEVADRLAVCINSCVGLSTKELEQIRTEMNKGII